MMTLGVDLTIREKFVSKLDFGGVLRDVSLNCQGRVAESDLTEAVK